MSKEFVGGGDAMLVELCEALGLGDLCVRRLELSLPHDDVFSAKVEFLVDRPGLERAVAVVRKYVLSEVPDVTLGG